MYDVLIVGGGPGGSTCAALCATAGLRTLLIEREIHPREKVCGDCLNPSCWPVLERLELMDRVRELPHGVLDRVEFIGIGGRTLSVALPKEDGEIAIKRSLLDHLLLIRARELGAEIREGNTVIALKRRNSDDEGWTVNTSDNSFDARYLVAADGRNSTVARLCNLSPRTARERVALQTHLPLPPDFGNRVVLQFLPEGYSGQAPVNDGELNLCLVSTPDKIAALRNWAHSEFGIPLQHPWRTITPLTREPIPTVERSLLFIGDAARVVEPFTGEGIYYALASGAVAADAIVASSRGSDETETLRNYAAEHARLYDGRLWINRLARAAVLSPRVASAMLEVLRFQPSLLRLLIGNIVRQR